MSKGNSRLEPRHLNWNEDLVERESDALHSAPSLGDKANSLDDNCLEVGREVSLVRGAMLAISLLGLLLIVSSVSFLVEQTISGRASTSFYMIGVPALVAFICVLAAFIRIDLAPPRQTPVRFCRKTRKIYWNSYKWTANPFGRWGPVFKVWDWDTVQAEILKVSGFNGKVYVTRYSLSLATCKPGTFEVQDREVLVGPSMGTVEFARVWSFICRYMAGGKDAVPPQSLRDNSVHYIRSLLSYYEYLLPGEWGRAARREIFGQGPAVAVASLFVIAITLWLMPVFLFLGMTNYIAMKFAPLEKWPEDIDAESRGITVEQLRQVKALERSKPREKPQLASIVAGALTIGLLAWLIWFVGMDQAWF